MNKSIVIYTVAFLLTACSAPSENSTALKNSSTQRSDQIAETQFQVDRSTPREDATEYEGLASEQEEELEDTALATHDIGSNAVRGYTDSSGYSRFTDDNGNTTRGYTDSSGYSRFTDDNGNTTRGYTDSSGYSRFTDDNGNTTRGYTDSSGYSRFTDDNGNTTRGYTDSSGYSRFTDDGGNTTSGYSNEE